MAQKPCTSYLKSIRKLTKYSRLLLFEQALSKSTVYARIRDYKARGTTETRTNLRGRKSSITSEDEEHIRELIEKNNDITIHEINRPLAKIKKM